MVESLEGRLLFSSVDTSSVALYAADGTTPATVNRHRALWILVHGANMNSSMMADMAGAVQAQLPADQWQVLTVDWSKLATGPAYRGSNALAAGGAVANLLKRAGVMASRVNLIGFSAGGALVGQLAADLNGYHGQQVNRIVGVDPAGYKDATDFAANSQYSIAFGGHDTYGGDAGS